MDSEWMWTIGIGAAVGFVAFVLLVTERLREKHRLLRELREESDTQYRNDL